VVEATVHRPFGQPWIEPGIDSTVYFSGTATLSRILQGEGPTAGPTWSGDIALKVSIALEGLIDALLLTAYIDNLTYCNPGVRQNFVYLFSGDIIEMNASNNTDRPSDRLT
jgi:hypothetical protein